MPGLALAALMLMSIPEAVLAQGCPAPVFTRMPDVPIAGNTSGRLRAGFFNNDAFIDLATADSGADAISILLGDGAGNFSHAPGSPIAMPQSPSSNGSRPTGLAIADFDGDGDTDIVASLRNASRIVLLRGNNTGTFVLDNPVASDAQGHDIVAGDFDRNGSMDVAVSNSGSSSTTVSIFLNNGSGGFSPAPGSPITLTGGTNSSDIAVGFFIGADSNLDLAVTQFSRDVVSILRGLGDGGFSVAQTRSVGRSPDSSPLDVKTTDFDGDTFPDLLVANRVIRPSGSTPGSSDNSVSILRGTSSGFLPAMEVFMGFDTGAATGADFNLDGSTDLAAANAAFTFGGSVRLNNGFGMFSELPVLFPANGNPFDVIAPDINNDGAPDLAILNQSANVTIYLNDCRIEPVVELSRDAVQFGGVEIGQTSPSEIVTLENTGVASLILGTLALAGANAGEFGFVDDGCSTQTLAPGGICTVELGFSPTATGARGAVLSIPSSAASNPDSVSLAGTGLQATLAMNSTNVDFGSVLVGANSAAAAVTVENTGSADLTLGTLNLGGANAGEFGFASDGCSNQTLAPAATCIVEFDFAPVATGPRNASVTVPSNAPTSPDGITLTGDGIQPDVALSPTAVDFGDVRVGTTTPAAAVTIENSGSAGLELGSLTVGGASAVEYGLNTDGCSGQTLAPAATCIVEFTFTPAVTGVRDATLSIPSNAPGNPNGVTLSGRGVQPELSANPTSVDFGEVLLGASSTGSTVSLENTGSADLAFGSVDIGGVNASDFNVISDTCSSQTLAPTSTCLIELDFTPIATGARDATLTIPSDAPSSPDAVPLAGTGTQPSLDLSLDDVDFGAVGPGHIATATILIDNSGTGDLVIDPITNPGAPFAIAGGSCFPTPATVTPGSSCDIQLEFAPGGLSGGFAEQFQIISSAPSSPDTVTLRGSVTGIPIPALQPWALLLLAVLMVGVGLARQRRAAT